MDEKNTYMYLSLLLKKPTRRLHSQIELEDLQRKEEEIFDKS